MNLKPLHRAVCRCADCSGRTIVLAWRTGLTLRMWAETGDGLELFDKGELTKLLPAWLAKGDDHGR